MFPPSLKTEIQNLKVIILNHDVGNCCPILLQGLRMAKADLGDTSYCDLLALGYIQ